MNCRKHNDINILEYFISDECETCSGYDRCFRYVEECDLKEIWVGGEQ